MATATRPRDGLMLIDGVWEPAGSGDALEDRDPGTGEVVGLLTRGGAEDVQRAVEAARRASPRGRRRPPRAAATSS